MKIVKSTKSGIVIIADVNVKIEIDLTISTKSPVILLQTVKVDNVSIVRIPPNNIVVSQIFSTYLVFKFLVIIWLLTVGYLCRRDKNTKTLYLLKTLLIAKIFDENFRPACINTLLPAVSSDLFF